MIFSKQFATMVKAGLPILKYWNVKRSNRTPNLKEIIEEIRRNLRRWYYTYQNVLKDIQRYLIIFIST